MNRLIRLIFVVTLWSATAASGKTPLDGLHGRELKTAVANHYAPDLLVTSFSEPGGVWQAFRSTDRADDGTVIDRFSAERRQFTHDGHSISPGMETADIIPAEWWGLTLNHQSPVTRDLHNLVPAPLGTGTTLRAYPPGTVSTTTARMGEWLVGIGYIADIQVNFVEPPDKLKGNVARALFYMISAHRCDLWRSFGANMLLDNDYPTLQPWARDMLLGWHAADPVDPAEMAKNTAVAAIQGNENPFVTYPELADHIWGDKSGEEFNSSPPAPDTPEDNPDEPDTPDNQEKTPLKGEYSINEQRIDLYSPFIPSDAQWVVDGNPVQTKHLIPAELGCGTHELRFTSPSLQGKIKIVIK